MVQKSRNPSSRLQAGHRNYSSGSAKAGLNSLHLTQKDRVPSKPQLKGGNSTLDLQQHGRIPSQFARQPHLNSNKRTHSKDRTTTLTQKVNDSSAAIKGKSNQRAGFSIARSDDTDEDEDGDWVSSESGAATPQNVEELSSESDEEEDGVRGATPVDRQRPQKPPRTDTGNGTLKLNGAADRVMMNGVEDRTTPRAEVDIDLGLTRVDTARPAADVHSQPSQQLLQQAQDPQLKAQQQHQQRPMETPTVHVTTHINPASSSNPSDTDPTKVAPLKPIRHTRSEAPSPPTKSALKRHSLIRNPSHQADAKIEMPNHPLIRGQTYHSSSLRPAQLAPLTVNSEVAQAQMHPSPSRAGSPPFSAGLHHSPLEASTISRVPSRKGSVSSLHSVATLPAPSSRFFGGGRSQPDRVRTMSTISNSSSSAALSALNMLPAASRPATPPMVVHFTPESRRDSDGLHQLLPSPYAPSHLTVVSKYNPLGACYERVARAKRGQ